MSGDELQPSRRQLFGAALVAVGAAATPFAIWARVRRGETGPASPRQRALLEVVCGLTIPDTDTPGAVAANVPAFVELALGHGLDGTRVFGSGQADAPPTGGLFWIEALGAALDAQLAGDFLTAAAGRQASALAAIDAAAFAPGGEAGVWGKLKDLIVTGYYTSEIGGSKELRYELVPGRWDADIPLTPDMRAFSSDWTAVDFG